MGKADPRRPERRDRSPNPAAVPAVPDERHLPGSKLDPDLMRPSGMQAYPDKRDPAFRRFNGLQYRPFAGCLLYTFAHLIDHKGLVGSLIMIQQITKQTGVFIRDAGNNRQILLDHPILLKQSLHFSTDGGRPGQHTNAAGRQIQAMNRKNRITFLLPDQIRQARRFRRYPDGFQTNDQGIIFEQ